jgi:hypothetical protein
MGDAVHGERVQAHLLCHHQQPQKALRRSLGKEFAKSMSHFTPNPMRSIPSNWPMLQGSTVRTMSQ